MKYAIALRGHIRDGLTDSRLRQFIEKLTHLRGLDELHIYCHSWAEHEAKSSYRELERDVVLKVTPQLIKHYFGKNIREHNIKSVEIADDKKLKLKGNLEGTILPKSPLPIVAWKRMWAGKRKLIDTIYDSGISYDKVINTRYDLFTHKLCLTAEPLLMRVINSNASLSFKYPIYTRNSVGVDNFYAGRLDVMRKLIHRFDDDLDGILSSNKKYEEFTYHEKLVYEYANDKGFIFR